VEGLGKRYHLAQGQDGDSYRTLRDTIVDFVKAPLRKKLTVEDFWALSDINFEIQQGEVVGIIGRNGAGKSTLLKILSKITKPTNGRVEINGRVRSLLEVGTGFHPELTGRENVFLNGSILGMSRREIEGKFDEIVAFAEVERFLDTPVKRYSSGMYVRLAFAVAAFLEPEILIVDEVLAVGDLAFQKKCLGMMGNVARTGRTILFVSHSMSSIQSLCSRAIALKSGRVEADGSVSDVVPNYLMQNATGNRFFRESQPANPIWVKSLEASVRYNKGRPTLYTKTEIYSEAEYKVSLDLRLNDAFGGPVGFSPVGSFNHSTELLIRRRGCVVSATHDIGSLANGNYFLSVDIANPTVGYHDRVEQCVLFEVNCPPTDGNYRCMEQIWGFGSVEFRYLGHEIEYLER
jgi:lipopolysaccharide transport system ATP-binding protein